MSAIRLRCSLGELEVSRIYLRSVQRGCWTATAEIGWAEAPADGEACSLRFTRDDGEEDVWTGAVLRSRVVALSERLSVTVMGGAGRLLAPSLAPRYQTAGATQVTGALVLAAIAADAGETLADGVEAELEAHALPSWHRMGGPAIDAIDTLAGVLGLGWRVLPTGELWMGAETWAEVGTETLDRAYFESGAPEDGSVTYACDGTPFAAGESVDGAQAVEVCYRYDAMLEDRSAGALRAEVRTALPGDPVYAPDLHLYRAVYAGTVQAESSNGALEVKCDDARMGDGLRGVPARTSWPGCKMTVPEGTRVRLAFESGLPTGCFALSSVDQDTGAELAFALLQDTVLSGSFTAKGVAPGADILFIYTPQGGAPGPANAQVNISGIITGPGHKYAKGRPA